MAYQLRWCFICLKAINRSLNFETTHSNNFSACFYLLELYFYYTFVCEIRN